MGSGLVTLPMKVMHNPIAMLLLHIITHYYMHDDMYILIFQELCNARQNNGQLKLFVSDHMGSTPASHTLLLHIITYYYIGCLYSCIIQKNSKQHSLILVYIYKIKHSNKIRHDSVVRSVGIPMFAGGGFPY